MYKGYPTGNKQAETGNYKRRKGISYHPTKGFRLHAEPPKRIWFEKWLPANGPSVLG